MSNHKMREDFEKWASKQDLDTSKAKCADTYEKNQTWLCWFAWQAALTQQPESEPGNLDVAGARQALELTATMDGLSLGGNNRKLTALLSLHGHLSDAIDALSRPQPTPQVPETATVEMLREGEESLKRGLKMFPDNFTQIVSNIWEDMRSAAPSLAETRKWVNIADHEPENDSIVWTRWTGMPDTEGRAPVTGEAAKSLTPYVRSLYWLDTGLRRPEPPANGDSNAG